MRVDQQWVFLGAKLLTGICFVAGNFLLCVDGDGWPSTVLACSDTSGYVLELSVTVRMVGTFSRFSLPLQRVAQRSQDISNLGTPNINSQLSQFASEVRKALASSSQ